jgi:hypothetical protein
MRKLFVSARVCTFVSALFTLSVSSVSYGAADIPAGDGMNDAGGGDPVLQVFDSRGQSVGPAFSTGPTTGAIVNANGVNILVPIQRVSNSAGHYSASQYQWAPTQFTPQFASSNCSLPPFVNDISAALRPVIVFRSGADATAYIAPDTYTQSAALGSYLNGTQCVMAPAPTSPLDLVPIWNVGSIYPLTQNYPEPLTIHY